MAGDIKKTDYSGREGASSQQTRQKRKVADSRKIMNKHLPSVLFRTLPVLAVILTVIEILSINQYAGSGKEIRTLDTAIDIIRQDNELLRHRIASFSSLTAIAVSSRGLGLIEPVKSQYLTIIPEQLPVAFNNPR